MPLLLSGSASARSQFLGPVTVTALFSGQAVGFPPSVRWRESLQLAVVVKIADGAEAYSALTQFFLISETRNKTLVCRLVLLLLLPDSGHTQQKSRARSCAACPGMVDAWSNDNGRGLLQGLRQMIQTFVTLLCRTPPLYSMILCFKMVLRRFSFA